MDGFYTIGQIARQLGVARSRLDYAVSKVGLQERGRAGIIRLFSPDQIPSMRAALETVRPHRTREEVQHVPACASE